MSQAPFSTQPTRGRMRQMVRRRGLTLMELMLVISTVGILMALAAPRFTRMRVRWSVEAAGQQLVRDLNRARTEAVKRNATFWLAKKSATAYDLEILGERTLPNGVTFTSGPDTVKFAAFGPAITGAGTFVLALQDETRRVIVNASGFASVQ